MKIISDVSVSEMVVRKLQDHRKVVDYTLQFFNLAKTYYMYPNYTHENLFPLLFNFELYWPSHHRQPNVMEGVPGHE